MTLTSFRVSKRSSTISNLVKRSKYQYAVPDYFSFRIFARHVAVVPASEGFRLVSRQRHQSVLGCPRAKKSQLGLEDNDIP
jgi:hypothetical protein